MIQNVNKFTIAGLLLSESVINMIRKDIRRLCPSIKIEVTEIEKILINEVFKRDVIEGEEAEKAVQKLKKLNRKTHKKAALDIANIKNNPNEAKPDISNAV